MLDKAYGCAFVGAARGECLGPRLGFVFAKPPGMSPLKLYVGATFERISRAAASGGGVGGSDATCVAIAIAVAVVVIVAVDAE